jgi:hypothetical protein
MVIDMKAFGFEVAEKAREFYIKRMEPHFNKNGMNLLAPLIVEKSRPNLILEHR